MKKRILTFLIIVTCIGLTSSCNKEKAPAFDLVKAKTDVEDRAKVFVDYDKNRQPVETPVEYHRYTAFANHI